LPNLLVPDLAEALRRSRAQKFYVCNVTTQPGETDGFTCGDHVRTLEHYLGEHLFDLVIANQLCEGILPEGVNFVTIEPDLDQRYQVYQADLLDRDHLTWHDSIRLAQTVIDLFFERTGPLAG